MRGMAAEIDSPTVSLTHDTRLPTTRVGVLGIGALCAYAVQNSVVSVLVSVTQFERYYNSQVAVLLQEIAVKLPLSLALLLYEARDPQVRHRLQADRWDWLAMGVPSVLYTLNMNSLYIGYRNVDAAIGQMMYESKIVFTAIFSVFLLGRRLDSQAWAGILALVLGVCIVQVDGTNSHKHGDNHAVGLVAFFTAAVCSALASVYLEYMLKTSACRSVWLRNVQLAVYGSAISALGLLIWPPTSRPLYGFNNWVFFSVIWQACGGLIVAVTLKYADSILRCFAQGVSLLVIVVASYLIFYRTITPIYALGMLHILLGLFAYNRICTPCKTPREPQCTKARGVLVVAWVLACVALIAWSSTRAIVLGRRKRPVLFTTVMVHLPRDEWKMERFRESLRVENITLHDLRLWPGVIVDDRPDLVEWAIASGLMRTPSAPQHRGNLGSALAHITLWQNISRQDSDAVFHVLEDNVLFTASSQETVSEMLTIDVDFLLLNSQRILGSGTSQRDVLQIPHGHWTHRMWVNLLLSSYLITPRGANALLHALRQRRCDLSVTVIDQCESVSIISDDHPWAYVLDREDAFGHIQTSNDSRVKFNDVLSE